MKQKTTKPAPFGFRKLTLASIGESWLWSSILIFVVGIIAHAGAIGAIFFQDDFGVLRNHSFPHWAPSDFRFTSRIIWWLDYRLAGMSPPVFHATNILLHSTVAVLLCFIARDWLSRIAKLNDQQARYGALIAALLFAVHPLGTEITHYVRALDTLLMTGLGFAAVYSLSRFTGKNWSQLILATVFALLACYSKPTGLLWIPGLALWTAGCFLSPAIWRSCFDRRHVVRGTLIALLGLVLVLHNDLSAAFYQIGEIVFTQVDSGSAWENALTQVRLTELLLQKLIWPADLVSDYFGAYSTTLSDPGVWLGIGITVSAIAVCVWLAISGRRVPLWTIGVLFGSHLLHCLYPVGDYYAEYRAYPSIVAFSILIGWVIAVLCRRAPRKRWLADVVVGLAIVLAIYTSHQRSSDWSTIETLSDDTLETYPWNMRAHYHGIQGAYERGDDGEVERRAVSMRKELPKLMKANRSLPYARHYNWSHSVLFLIHAEGTTARSLVRLNRSAEAIGRMRGLGANLKKQTFAQQHQFQASYDVFFAVMLADLGSYTEAWDLVRPYAKPIKPQPTGEDEAISWKVPWWLKAMLEDAAKRGQENGHPFTFEENQSQSK